MCASTCGRVASAPKNTVRPTDANASNKGSMRCAVALFGGPRPLLSDMMAAAHVGWPANTDTASGHFWVVSEADSYDCAGGGTGTTGRERCMATANNQCTSTPSNTSSGQPMQNVPVGCLSPRMVTGVHVPYVVPGDVRIDLSCADVGMAEHRLHRS